METKMEEHNILVVDDNQDFADVFCDILRANNYKADSCYGGEQALSMINDQDYDIMFLDIRMPQMDGVQTLKEIKKVQPEAMVIMMTGYSVDELVHQAIEEKASEIIYKPFEIDKVLGLIKDI
ncbi:MAG: response regulator [Candidatus Omnitrophica bacterium]|nr:response regulator [Candidatus Omnitrophota bacterium]